MIAGNVENPYDILGVSRDASLDEVKKAYRKKARENHPDLNPGDTAAEERMNKINEAYDRITNPEKYRASDARKRSAGYGGSGAGDPFGGAGGYGGYGGGAGWSGGAGGSAGAGGAGYREGGSGGAGGQSSDAGPYGWTTINIDFEDLFGGGFGATQAPVHPEEAAGDSSEVRQAIAAINAGQPAHAVQILQQIPSTGRNARWYYLFALANDGAGNTVAAHDNIRRARQLDPQNMDYQRVENAFTRRAQTYTQQGEGRGFTTLGFDPAWCCCSAMICPTLCMNAPVICCL